MTPDIYDLIIDSMVEVLATHNIISGTPEKWHSQGWHGTFYPLGKTG